MCAIDGCERPAFYNQVTRKARKDYKCDECQRTILKGELYVNTSGKWDGDLNMFRHCSHCEKIAELLVEQCGGYLHGAFEMDLEDHIDPGYPWAMRAARLLVGMRRQWKCFKSDELMRN